MANYLCFWDHTEHDSITAMRIAKHKHGTDLDLVDTYGLDQAGITSAITGLGDDTYQGVYITVGVAQTHAAGNLTKDDVASLYRVMAVGFKGTVISEGDDCQANATVTEIVLESGESASNDALNGYYILTTGVTEVFREIKDYVGSTKTVTVNTTTVAVTTTEDYIVYSLDYVYELGNGNSTNGKSCAHLTWEGIYPDTQIPWLVHLLTDYKHFADYGTASAANGTTITLAASAGAGANKTRANDVYNGMMVYIYSATTNKGSYGTITDYVDSTKVATIGGWTGGTPATSIVYRIIANPNMLFYEPYAELFIKTYFSDILSVTAEQDFADLIDKNRKVNEGTLISAEQDLELLDEYLIKGKAIWDYTCL